MALFTINITEGITTPYVPNTNTLTEENCNTEQFSYPVRMTDGDPESYTPNEIYLLYQYSGLSWKTLNISDIVYSDFGNCYLDYYGVPMTINTIHTIDVSLISSGQNIPGLTVIRNITQSDLTDMSIDFNIQIDNIEDTSHGVVEGVINTVSSSCLTPPEPLVSNISSSTEADECDGITFTVSAPPNADVNYIYKTLQKSSGGFTGGFYELDAPNGNEIRTISNFSNSLNIDLRIIENIGPTGVMHLKARICSNPQTPPQVPTGAFTITYFDVMNNANTDFITRFELQADNTN